MCKKVEIETDNVKYAEEDQFWIAQACLVYGKDLQTKRFKIGKDIMFHIINPDNTDKAIRMMKKHVPDKRDVCTWLCKQILRSGIELCYERSNKYSRDLYRCYETFSGYYPDKKDEMKEVLHLALNPSDNENEILELSKKWATWFTAEKERLGY